MNQTCHECGGSLYRFQERVYCPICNPQAKPESPAVNRLTREQAEVAVYKALSDGADGDLLMAEKIVAVLLGDCPAVLVEEKK